MDAATWGTVPQFTLKGWVGAGKVLRVHDGDTLHLAVELFGAVHRLCCRLDGINAPELNDAARRSAAFRARNRLISLTTSVDIGADDERSDRALQAVIDQNILMIQVKIVGADKFGRWLVELHNKDCHVNSTLLAEGHATPFM